MYWYFGPKGERSHWFHRFAFVLKTFYCLPTNMFKKLKPGESEEDILRMSSEFAAERAKNPGFQPAAAFVRADRGK